MLTAVLITSCIDTSHLKIQEKKKKMKPKQKCL